MKDIVINSIMNNITKYKDYDEEKLKIIKYGLSSLYLHLTKVIVTFIIAYLLGLLLSLLKFMFFYTLLRLTAFGVHAKKSIHCWIASLISFVLVPYLCETLTINIYIKLVICFICLLLIILYAPADTEKRPLINKKKRITYKIISILTTTAYISLLLILKNNVLGNCIFFSIVFESLLILPITYKLFGVKYNNYKNCEKRKE